MFFFSSRRRHTRFDCDWSSDVCSSDLGLVFNVGTGGRYTLNHTLRLLEKISGKRANPRYDPPREGDIRDSQADIGLARTILGYEPRVGFEEGLRRTWEWYYATHRSEAAVQRT